MKKGDALEIEGLSYTIESKIAQGGNAHVWAIRSEVDGHTYALKQIGKAGRSSTKLERFRKEIDFGIAADHAHVVKILASAETATDFLYVMELYHASLRQVVADEFDIEVLLGYLSQLCESLAYVHGEGIAHRDIKPENILVDKVNHRLVIADFGIAHFKDSLLTRKNEALGNRSYQAPEQMTKRPPDGVGAPADVFALGVIMTELFTKQNARGAQHKKIRHVYPFLSDLDDLAERMMLQDSRQRITMTSARDTVKLIRRQTHEAMDGIVTSLRRASTPPDGHDSQSERVLKVAARDVLSAKHIFERASSEELASYNRNYHCEIAFRVSQELFNLCVNSRVLQDCKRKFQNEMRAGWGNSEIRALADDRKAAQLQEFEEMQREYPVLEESEWNWVPLLAAHYFRFCKEYHCDELLASAREAAPSLQRDLIGAPVLWIVSSLRGHLAHTGLEIAPSDLHRLSIEDHLRIEWPRTSLTDEPAAAHSAALIEEPFEIVSVLAVLDELRENWDVSVGEQANGKFTVAFASLLEFERFRAQALAVAPPGEVLEGDIIDMLRPVAAYEDLVTLVWDPLFTIRVTLAKVLRLRDP